jgi:hypothetical protein
MQKCGSNRVGQATWQASGRERRTGSPASFVAGGTCFGKSNPGVE